MPKDRPQAMTLTLSGRPMGNSISGLKINKHKKFVKKENKYGQYFNNLVKVKYPIE